MFFNRSQIHRIRVPMLLSLVALITLVTLAHRLRVSKSGALTVFPNSSLAATTSVTGDEPQAKALPILLKVGGFQPSEITTSAGTYYLVVGNLSGVEEVALKLDREHGSRLHEASAKRQKPWKRFVHFTPGTYLLTESNHSEWMCRITITAN